MTEPQSSPSPPPTPPPPPFNPLPIIAYLQIDPASTSSPSPSDQPIEFLTQYLRQLPPALLLPFSSITTPKQRTVIPIIRNRRLKYTAAKPGEFSASVAVNKWPLLWTGPGPSHVAASGTASGSDQRRGKREAEDEKDWADRLFMDGTKQHVGRLGKLLGEYEEEREAEHARMMRRNRVDESFVPEEDEDEDEEDEQEVVPLQDDPETLEDMKSIFERRVRERFIYGLLGNVDYDAIDWDDQWDDQIDRDDEDRWFGEDDDDEGDGDGGSSFRTFGNSKMF